MKITWHGHSSFLIESSTGIKLLTDPFDESVGYNVFKKDVDLVTISHQHFDHNYTKSIKNNPRIIKDIGSYSYDNINIKGILSYHDHDLGAKRGENIIYVIEVDGFRICHLGDLGHTLSKEILDKIGAIDVLLIPVGGNYTIDGKEAMKVATSINSNIIIPMHYKTPYLSFPLDGVEPFITAMNNGDRLNNSSLNLDFIPETQNTVKILDPINQNI